MPRPRKRSVSFILLVLAIAAGLASRLYASHLPPILHKNAGDVLWATALYFLLTLVSPRAFPGRVFVLTFALGAAVELSKLLTTPWLTTFRHTTAGGLLLGHAFSWSNILCYLLGAFLALILDAPTAGLGASAPPAKR